MIFILWIACVAVADILFLGWKLSVPLAVLLVVFVVLRTSDRWSSG